MAETIHSTSAKISIRYSQRLYPNVDYEVRPILSNVTTTQEFDVYRATTYLEKAPATEEKINGLINQLAQACEEAFVILKKLSKVASDIRVDISVDREAYDKENYRQIGQRQHESFWLCKSYTFHPEVLVRRGLASLGSTNPNGGTKHLEYKGKELARVFRNEVNVLCLKARGYLEDVLVKNFTPQD